MLLYKFKYRKTSVYDAITISIPGERRIQWRDIIISDNLIYLSVDIKFIAGTVTQRAE